MRRWLILLSLVFTTACSSLPAGEAPVWRRWSAAHGGVLDPSEAAHAYARAQAALARLASSCDCADKTVYVLRASDPAAFAFRDGSILVTRGLVALLDDGELAAAVAHEIGHLTGRGDGLPGTDAERLADQLGSELLRASGLPPGLMLRMLRKLDAAERPVAPGLAARIAALELLPAAAARVAMAE